MSLCFNKNYKSILLKLGLRTLVAYSSGNLEIYFRLTMRLISVRLKIKVIVRLLLYNNEFEYCNNKIKIDAEIYAWIQS